MLRWIWIGCVSVAWAQAPCASDEYKKYDRLLGERFRKAVHGCVLVEDTPGVKGLHFYDPAVKAWRSVVVSGEGVTEEFSLEKPPKPPAACPAADNRQFDFWLGKWEVFNPRGILVGTNHIHAAAGGCALVENWTAANLTTGISLNFRDKNKWRQVWVSPQGSLDLAGEWDGAALRYRNDSTFLTFTPNKDGSVRQYWEQKSGSTWSISFDGTYRRARERTRSELITELESAGRATGTLFDGVSATQAQFRQAEGRWTLHEILDHLVESEKLFQNIAKTLAAGPAPFDPGFVEPLILPVIPNRRQRLTAPEALRPKSSGKPLAELLREFNALRAETVRTVETIELRGGRRQHPLGPNLDVYQWLASASGHNRRHLEQAIEVQLDPRFDPAKGIRAWAGRWSGEGKFQGAPTKIVLTWTPILGGKFDELRIDLANGFSGRAVYGAGLTAHWNDSMGNAYAVKGSFANNALSAEWGPGRSTYTMNAAGDLEVRDEIQGRVFASYLLKRDPQTPSEVWDIRRSDGGVTPNVAIYTSGDLPDADAVYYVEAGRATLEAGVQRIPVQPGTIVRVRRGTKRAFVEVSQPLRVLVYLGAGG
ncbi:MAG: hypothetical protein FJW30_11270 [Acidobacteria bacterium]|nr:hypothetical protein [Acidobacteriota bacterium]